MTTLPRDTMNRVETSPAFGPTRQTVASFDNYRDAQRAVDYLSDRKFPVERAAIVAEGLRFVEQVTGRRGWGNSALSGALSGAVVGVLIGFIFGLFSLIEPLVSALVLAFYGLIFGAIVGIIIGLIAYAFSGGRRDFTSIGGVQADRYNVVIDNDVAAEAMGLLEEMR